MAGEIILNLDLPEYQDDFLSSKEGGEQNGLWQQEANKTLVSHLDKMGRAARHYKQEHVDKNCQAAKLSSYHHAIFISGARGTGKTVFLRNIQAVWEANKKNHVQSASDLPDLHFIDAIDPTLLNIHDRFSEVIIASVYAAVEKKLKLPNIAQSKKDGFYSALKTLSGSLGVASEFDEYRGIDRLQKYRSGIHLEKYFHQFLIASVDLLGCDALVLPIDDVDMKIDNAFGVLDDIRCILSCPLILPLVSGDDDLYRHITTMQFENSLAKNSHASNFNEGKVMAERLSKAYLTKVFPNHTRLPLVPISQLLSKLKIQGKVQSDNCTFSEYENKMKNVFYHLCNGQERSTDWPKPDSAREVTQLIRLLTPSQLDDDNIVDEQWRKFSIWAEEKQDGIALTNAESFLKVRTMQPSEALDLNSLIAFNPLLQKNRYSWAKKDFYHYQVKCIKNLSAHANNVDILDSVFQKTSENIDSKENNILRSMPPLEFTMGSLYVSKTAAEQQRDSYSLLDIYTYNNYYTRQMNRRNHIFFSRAFEILSWSMLAVTGNLPAIFSERENFKAQFSKVFARAPFYSSFALNPTRVIDESGGDVAETESSNVHVQHTDDFVNEVYEWYCSNKFQELSGENLIPLISVIFNKVFSQLSELRSNIQQGRLGLKDEYLSDMARRFEYIYINALTSFVRTGEVINANVATSASSVTVRDFNRFVKSDVTLSKNILGLIDWVDGYTDVCRPISNEIYVKLIMAMWTHPIFSLVVNCAYSIGASRSESKSSEEHNNGEKEVDVYDLNFNGIKKLYFERSGSSSVRINEVAYWASNNSDLAMDIFERISNDAEMYLEIGSRTVIGRMYSGLARGLGIEE